MLFSCGLAILHRYAIITFWCIGLCGLEFMLIYLLIIILMGVRVCVSVMPFVSMVFIFLLLCFILCWCFVLWGIMASFWRKQWFPYVRLVAL